MDDPDRSAPHNTLASSLTTFLGGRTTAHGLFEDRFGRVRRRFTATLDGAWDGGVFVLDERFVYDDGETEHRVWRLQPGANGRFTASTSDSPGGARGVMTASGTRMRYKFRLRLKSRALTVSFDDRIDIIDSHRALNRATVSKWGMTLGTVVIMFERQRGAEQRLVEPRDTAWIAEAAE